MENLNKAVCFNERLRIFPYCIYLKLVTQMGTF
jgi:hypothetical protein